MTHDLGAVPRAIGLTIALYSLPPALSATISGAMVDRLGPRPVLLAAPLLIMRKALKRHGSPDAITTDGLRSYRAALNGLAIVHKQERGGSRRAPPEPRVR